MNTRNLLLLAIVAALAGGGIWYLTQSPAPEPVKAAEPKAAAPAPAPAAPKPAVTQIAAPKAPPATPSTAATKPTPVPAANTPNGEAVKELESTLGEMTTMLQSGDLAGLMEKFMPPDQLAQMTPDMRAQMQQVMAMPQMQQQLQMMGQALESLKGQTPTFNDAGDKATYQMTPPPGMIPPGANVPPTIPVTFVKINGRWYTGNDGPGF